MREYTKSYAQNREDIILSGFFPGASKGFYVDVGANDPDNFSVTRFFYERGWHGLNIEPIQALYERLERRRPRDTNLNIGISNKTGKLKFREYKGMEGLSTFSSQIKQTYNKNPSTLAYADIEVSVFPLKSVFEENNVHTIDFMKVDVEGFEYEVLEGNDWSMFRPKVLCIEANHIVKDWRKLVKKQGYDLVFFDGINEYYVAKEHRKIADSFSYEQSILAKPPLHETVYNELDNLRRIVEKLSEKYEAAQAANRHLIVHTQRLEMEKSQIPRVRTAMILLAKALDRAVVDNLRRLDHSRQSNPVLVISKTMNPTEIIRAIRWYDFQVYSQATPGFVFRVVYKVYRLPIKAVYIVLRKVYLTLKGVRSG